MILAMVMGTVIAALMVIVGISARRFGQQWENSIQLGQAIIFHDYQKVESLLRAGVNPNAADVGDSLILAIAGNDTGIYDKRMVALLLKYGANPSLSLSDARNVEIARALLNIGASPNAPVGSRGETPLMEHCLNGNTEVVRYLLEHGGDPEVRDKDGSTLSQRIEYVEKNHPENATSYAQIRALLGRFSSP